METNAEPHASAHSIRQVIALLPSATAVYGQHEQLIYANPVFNQTFPHLLPEHSYTHFLAGFEGNHATPSDCKAIVPLPTEFFCRHSRQSYRIHSAAIDISDREKGRMVTAQCLTHHIESLHRQQRLHEQLLLTSRSLSVGEMATTIAHELNQPLSSIINYLNGAQRALIKLDNAPQRLSEALRLALVQASQAAAVIMRIREFVQQREPRKDICSLSQLIDHVVELLQHEARQHRVRVIIQLDSSLPLVMIDRVMVIQVLANLMRNAIDSMATTPPQDRFITLTATLDAERRVVVRVFDRGCGINPDQASQLFTAFYTTKPEGLGAGLAICRSIIEYHDGSLYCEPNPQGGTCFVFTLPTQGA